METIHNFKDFTDRLYEAGMSMGGENGEGVFSLASFFGEEINWHTEDPETDPWQWRMRVLEEKSDIAAGKLFFRKTGYLTSKWYPYFYAIRRGTNTLMKEYDTGLISQAAKQIYEILTEYPACPAHLIRSYGGFKKEDNSSFERALTDLQMNFYIAVCGQARKVSKDGQEYGWNSNVYCRTEEFWGSDFLKKASKIPYQKAFDTISAQIKRLNPDASDKKIRKFILG